MIVNIIVSAIFVSLIQCQNYGEVLDACVLQENGEKSICVLLEDCEAAKRALKQNKFPQHCGFVGNESIVCCPEYKKIKESLSTGDLARKACAKFYDLSLETESNRDNVGCFLNSRGGFDCPVSGGELVIDFKDFKHMALVGFDDDGEKNWQCGGSLISEHYVLTAAHCLSSRQLGKAKYVRLGDLDYSTDSDNTRYQDFTISETIKHPNYSYVSSYNDIALLKLHIPAIFDDYVKPACLQTKNDIEFYAGALMVAGWGATQYNENVGSPQLRKAAVEVFTQESCSNIYPKAPRGLNMGIVEELQICAGSYIDESNTCKGDSGGPLQLEATIENKTLSFIVGVTSTGKACGFKGIPGVYTRVSSYVGWIEEVIWKEKR